MGKLFYGSFFFVVNDINGFWNKRQYHSAVHIAHLLREAHLGLHYFVISSVKLNKHADIPPYIL